MLNILVVQSLKDRKIIDVIEEPDKKFISLKLDDNRKISFSMHQAIIVEKIADSRN